jgi:hypothetical protein
MPVRFQVVETLDKLHVARAFLNCLCVGTERVVIFVFFGRALPETDQKARSIGLHGVAWLAEYDSGTWERGASAWAEAGDWHPLRMHCLVTSSDAAPDVVAAITRDMAPVAAMGPLHSRMLKTGRALEARGLVDAFIEPLDGDLRFYARDEAWTESIANCLEGKGIEVLRE